MRTVKDWSVFFPLLVCFLMAQAAQADSDVVRAQLAQSLPLLGVDRVHQEHKITGSDVGIFVIDDWSLNEEGFIHGQAVLEILQAVAPGAEVWSCKLVFPKVTELDFVLCLQRIVRERLPIRVVNMSFAVGHELFQKPCGSITDSLLAREIRQLSQKGVIFVAASGNDGRKDSLRFPACLPEVISVGATYDLKGPVKFDSKQIYCEDVAVIDNVTCYSDVADFLDLVAPGSTISTPSARDFGGTSAAAPLVSGVVALMLQANPTLTRSTILEELQATGAKAYDPLISRSFPRVDAYRAVQAVLGPGLPPSDLQVVAQFDANRNGVIEDSEFFKAVDAWLASRISESLFFRVIDSWIQRTTVSSSDDQALLCCAGRIRLFDLQGRFMAEMPTTSLKDLRFHTKALANGGYIFVTTYLSGGRLIHHVGKLAVLR